MGEGNREVGLPRVRPFGFQLTRKFPLEYIADDDLDLKAFQQKLNQAEKNRGELTARVTLFYRSS